MKCPECGALIAWDEAHSPAAWRHVHTDSRWCEAAPRGNPRYPHGCTDRNYVGRLAGAE